MKTCRKALTAFSEDQRCSCCGCTDHCSGSFYDPAQRSEQKLVQLTAGWRVPGSSHRLFLRIPGCPAYRSVQPPPAWRSDWLQISCSRRRQELQTRGRLEEYFISHALGLPTSMREWFISLWLNEMDILFSFFSEIRGLKLNYPFAYHGLSEHPTRRNATSSQEFLQFILSPNKPLPVKHCIR